MNEHALLDALRPDVADCTPAQIVLMAMDSIKLAEAAYDCDSPMLIGLAMRQASVWARLAMEHESAAQA